MTKIHVISDLFLGFNEKALEELEIPDVDIVIVNGNIGHSKRSMLYLEMLCNKYPDIIFVYNLGFTERYRLGGGKLGNEAEVAEKTRSLLNSNYPKNLNLLLDESKIFTTKDNRPIDIMCVFGFPRIVQVVDDWEKSWYHTNICMGITRDIYSDQYKKPDATSYVEHGDFPIMATVEHINNLNERETTIIRNWEVNSPLAKILVTHINPYNDDRNKGLKICPHLIHLEYGLWVTAGNKVEKVKFLGADMVSNPGRGSEPRSHVIVF
jgi:hypothetical protein